MSRTLISLNQLTYTPDGASQSLFSNLNAQFQQARYGLVGVNGIGKTTLLRLIAGELVADSGACQQQGACLLLPTWQDFAASATNINSVLGLDDDNWAQAWQAQAELAKLGLYDLDFTRCFAELSAGEQSKVLLTKLQLLAPDMVLLDEPSEALDTHSREVLLNWLSESSCGFIIASHDRHLLNHMDYIVELTAHGLVLYGGNYDFYREQKQIAEAALLQEVQSCQQALNKAKKLKQINFERHQQRQAKGRRTRHEQIRAKGSYDKIELKGKEGRSQKTNKRLRELADRKLTRLEDAWQSVSAELSELNLISARLKQTKLPSHKQVLTMEEVSFAYGQNDLLIKDFNLNLVGPKRIALTGNNGCGKSTLLKLILGQLQPCAGQIKLSVDNIAYLDQRLDFLNDELSLIENFMQYHPTLDYETSFSALAAFQFRQQRGFALVKELSSGERLRLALAMVLMGEQPVQLLLLDEPSNHLDLAAREALEQILQQYQGALMVVSHDVYFRNALHLDAEIHLGIL